MEEQIEELKKRVALLEEMVGTSSIPEGHRNLLRSKFLDAIWGRVFNHLSNEDLVGVVALSRPGGVLIQKGKDNDPDFALKVTYNKKVVLKVSPKTLEDLRCCSSIVDVAESFVETYDMAGLE